MSTAIKAEYATKSRSTDIAIERVQRAFDGVHSVNRRGLVGRTVGDWWTGGLDECRLVV